MNKRYKSIWVCTVIKFRSKKVGRVRYDLKTRASRLNNKIMSWKKSYSFFLLCIQMRSDESKSRSWRKAKRNESLCLSTSLHPSKGVSLDVWIITKATLKRKEWLSKFSLTRLSSASSKSEGDAKSYQMLRRRRRKFQSSRGAKIPLLVITHWVLYGPARNTVKVLLRKQKCFQMTPGRVASRFTRKGSQSHSSWVWCWLIHFSCTFFPDSLETQPQSSNLYHWWQFHLHLHLN